MKENTVILNLDDYHRMLEAEEKFNELNDGKTIFTYKPDDYSWVECNVSVITKDDAVRELSERLHELSEKTYDLNSSIGKYKDNITELETKLKEREKELEKIKKAKKRSFLQKIFGQI